MEEKKHTDTKRKCEKRPKALHIADPARSAEAEPLPVAKLPVQAQDATPALALPSARARALSAGALSRAGLVQLSVKFDHPDFVKPSDVLSLWGEGGEGSTQEMRYRGKRECLL